MSYASLQKTEEWDHEKFRKDFCMECYSPPLRVRLDVALVSSSTNVAPDEKTFLESTFQITDNNSIRFWLKGLDWIPLLTPRHPQGYMRA
jgi:hypothetical protein